MIFKFSHFGSWFFVFAIIFGFQLIAEPRDPNPSKPDCRSQISKLTYFSTHYPIATSPADMHLEWTLMHAKDFDTLSHSIGDLITRAKEPGRALEMTKILFQAYRNANANAREILNTSLQSLYTIHLERVRHLPDSEVRRDRQDALTFLETNGIFSQIIDDYIAAIKSQARREIETRFKKEFADQVNREVLDLSYDSASLLSTIEAKVFFETATDFPRPTISVFPSILGFKFEPVHKSHGRSQPVLALILQSLHGSAPIISDHGELSTDLNLKARYVATIALHFQRALASLLPPDALEADHGGFPDFEAQQFLKKYNEAVARENANEAARNAKINNLNTATDTEGYLAFTVAELKSMAIRMDHDGIENTLKYSSAPAFLASTLLPTAELIGDPALISILKIYTEQPSLFDIDAIVQSAPRMTDPNGPVWNFIASIDSPVAAVKRVSQLLDEPNITPHIRHLLLQHLALQSHILPSKGFGLGVGLPFYHQAQATADSLAARYALTELAEALNKYPLSETEVALWADRLVDRRLARNPGYLLLVDEALLQLARNPKCSNGTRRFIEFELRAGSPRSAFTPFSLETNSALSERLSFRLATPSQPVAKVAEKRLFEEKFKKIEAAFRDGSSIHGSATEPIQKLTELVNTHTFTNPSILWQARSQIELFFGKAATTAGNRALFELAEALEQGIRRSMIYYGSRYVPGAKNQTTETVLFNAIRNPYATELASQILAQPLSDDRRIEDQLVHLSYLYTLSRQVQEKLGREIDPSNRKRLLQSFKYMTAEMQKTVLRQESSALKTQIEKYKEHFEGKRAEKLQAIIDLLSDKGIVPTIKTSRAGLALLESYRKVPEIQRYHRWIPNLSKALKSTDTEVSHRAMIYLSAQQLILEFHEQFGGDPYEIFAVKTVLDHWRRQMTRFEIEDESGPQ